LRNDRPYGALICRLFLRTVRGTAGRTRYRHEQLQMIVAMLVALGKRTESATDKAEAL